MQIKIGNSVIPATPGTSLPLVLRSPIFIPEDGKIPGSYIFNTSFPASNVLRNEFNQAQRIQRHGRATSELPYLITAGSLRFQGNCIVTLADAEQFEIAFKVDNGELAGILFGKSLKYLDLGGEQVITSLFSLAHSEAFNFPLFNFISYHESRFAAFGIVDSDFTLSFNTGTEAGTSFTAKSNGLISHTIISNCQIIKGSIKIRVYKNDTLIQSIALSESGSNKTTFSYNLIMGDVIKVWFWVCSTSIAPFQSELSMPKLFHSFTKPSNAFDETVSKTQDNSDYAIFPITNTALFDNFPDDAFMLDNLSLKTVYSLYFPVQNYFHNGHFPLMLCTEIGDELFFAANLFTPFVYLNTILSKIITEAGYTCINNPFESNGYKGMVLFNAFVENTFFGNNVALLPVNPTFNLSDHVPDISQSDFINWISKLTGYYPVVDNNLLTVTFVNCATIHSISNDNPATPFPGILLPYPKITISHEYKGIKLELKKANPDKYLSRIKELNSKLTLKGEVADPRDLPTSGNAANDMYYVLLNQSYYVFQYNPETYKLEWCFFSEKFPLVYSEGTEPFLTVETDLSPVLTHRELDNSIFPARLWTIPKTEQAGTIEGFPDSLSAEYGLQVLYYKGMALDSLDQPYPLGSCRYEDYPGDPALFAELNADALFTSHYKEFLQWLAYETKPATFKAILTTGQLKQLKFNQIYSGNGFHFLIKEIRVNLLIDGLSLAELDIYTC
ncbi:MAG: hypothetical protein WCI92_16790 [Bacteroidota bacterium]